MVASSTVAEAPCRYAKGFATNNKLQRHFGKGEEYKRREKLPAASKKIVKKSSDHGVRRQHLVY